MRKQLLVAALGLAALLPFSCTQEWEEEGARQIKAGDRITITGVNEEFEGAKTSLLENPRQILWSPGDQISLFFGPGTNGGSLFTSTNTEEATVASFDGILKAVTLGADENATANEYSFTVVYPYSPDNICEVTSTDSVFVTATLPDVQEARDASFGNNSFITVGNSQTFNISFRSVCSGVTFTVDRADIKSVVLEGLGGEYLAGRARISVVNGVPEVKEVLDGRTSVTLNAPGGETFRPGVKYYLLTLPVSLPSGISMTFYTDEEIAVRKWTTAKNFARNTFTNWNNINNNSGVTFYKTKLSASGGYMNQLPQLVNDLSEITEIRFITKRDDRDVPDARLMNGNFRPNTAFAYGLYNDGVLEMSTAGPAFTMQSSLSRLFSDFSNLHTITGWEYIRSGEILDMSRMFEDCGIESLNLNALSTSGVTSMVRTFRNMPNLRSLRIENFSTEDVTDFTNMFAGAVELDTIYLGDGFVIGSDATTTGMFGNAQDGWLGENNTGVRTVFMCNSAQEAAIRNLLGAEAVNYAFGGESGRYAILPDGQTFTSELRVSSLAGSLSNITEIRFVASSSTTGVLVNSGLSTNPVYGTYSDGVLEIHTPAEAFMASADCEKMFSGLTNLEAVHGLTNVCTENVTSMKMMFALDTKLASLDLSGFNTSKVTDMNKMFNNCRALTSLDLSSFQTTSVTDMTEMFSSCYSLEELDVSGFVTDHLATSNNIFKNTTVLSSLVLGKSFWILPGAADTPFGVNSSDLMGYGNTPDPRTVITCTFSQADTIRTILGSAVSHYSFNLTDAQSAYLPAGPVFNSMLTAQGLAPTLKDIKEIHFITENSTTGVLVNDGCGDAPIYANYNDGVVEITTIAREFFTDKSCNSMFSLLTNVQMITGWEHINTSNTTSMSMMFYRNYRLKSLDVSHFNTENVTDMFCLFDECMVLKSLDLSNFNTSKVIDMRRMFWDCEALDTLDVRSFNTANVKDMERMFGKTEHLSVLKLGKEFVVCKSAWAMFEYRGWMGEKNLPDPRTTIYCNSEQERAVKTRMGAEAVHYAFADDMSVNGQLPDGPTFQTYLTEDNFDGMAPTIKSITEVRFVPNSSKTGVLMNEGLGDVPVYCSYNDGVVEITTPGEGFVAAPNCRMMFSLMTYVTTIDGLPSVSTRRVTDMGMMFANCYYLESLDLSNFNTEKVTNMHRMFRSSSLRSIDLSSFNTSNVTNISYMFDQSPCLENLDLSSFNTEKVNNMEYMLAGATSLKTLVFGPGWVFNRLDAIFGPFNEVSALGLDNTPDPRTVITCPASILSYIQDRLGANALHYSIIVR